MTKKSKNSDKEKYVYSGCRITFDSPDLWGFGNGFARNVIIFGVDNSSHLMLIIARIIFYC